MSLTERDLRDHIGEVVVLTIRIQYGPGRVYHRPRTARLESLCGLHAEVKYFGADAPNATVPVALQDIIGLQALQPTRRA